MENKRHICFAVLLYAVLSCGQQSEITISNAAIENICQIDETEVIINEPSSFDIIDSTTFILTDQKNVLLFSTEGKLIRKIGNSGKAKFEFNRPNIVRSYKDTIYVWSSGSLKFISYTKDGVPISEYKYLSAVVDFRISGNYIFIYTAGRRSNNIVDVYDMSSERVIKTLTSSSAEHRFLLHNVSSVPLCCIEDKLYYAPKDKLSLFVYDTSEDENRKIIDITSESFEVNHVNDTNMIIFDRKKAMEYFFENSMTIMISPQPEGFYILTSEGKFQYENGELKDSDKFYGLYSVTNGKSNMIAQYSYASIGSIGLFCSYNETIYILCHEIKNGNDIYSLGKLVI